MPQTIAPNPAELAAQQALDSVFTCIRQRKNFRLEAGAGAGKTYSLVEALKCIISERGTQLQRANQQVACITFTNVATDEITSRTDGHPVVYSSTIHAFCWSLIKDFQPFLRQKLAEIEGWPDLLKELGGIDSRRIDYELGHRRAKTDETNVSLGHNDVLSLTVLLMGKEKFRSILTGRFPILFIDEYQDTNKDFAESIVSHFIMPGQGPLIGLFGDSWQKIYADGCGLIDHTRLVHINKRANFRSVKTIVDVLNRIRPDLPQEVKDPKAPGYVAVFHSNGWAGPRRSADRGNHWKGDLLPADAHRHLESTRALLEREGWEFSPDKTKILMLTHGVLAAEQHYAGIAGVFKYNDSFLKKENCLIHFLVNTLEPVCIRYKSGLYGEMFSILGSRTVTIKSLEDKRLWARDMDRLLELRNTGTIGQVIDHLQQVERPSLSDAVTKIELTLAKAGPDEIDADRDLKETRDLRNVPYQEVISLAQYLNESTPFSTKHGVKGAEFENVLVVFGRGWNQYDWNRFLELARNTVSEGDASFYERNRNLFYVVSSRPKVRLALLFTQKLSQVALSTLGHWFGEETVIPIGVE